MAPFTRDLFPRQRDVRQRAKGAPQLTGFFDFYFAGVDSWLFDLAVCLNDWCIDLETGARDGERTRALIGAYTECAPLTAR